MKCENVINDQERLKIFFDSIGYNVIRTELVLDDQNINEPYYLVFCEKNLSDMERTIYSSLCKNVFFATSYMLGNKYANDYTAFACNDNGMVVYFKSENFIEEQTINNDHDTNKKLSEKWVAFYNDCENIKNETIANSFN